MSNRKNEIIDATIRHIAMHGDSFSMAQVASDVGCSQSLIFKYYPSKEQLLNDCFDFIRLKLKEIFQRTTIPDRPDRESINRWMLDVWFAYSDFLKTNSHCAKAFVFFVSTNMNFPRRYESADSVIKTVVGQKYDAVVEVYPDFLFVAEYILLLSNLAVIGNFICWKDRQQAIEEIGHLLEYGLCGKDSAYARDPGSEPHNCRLRSADADGICCKQSSMDPEPRL